MVFRSHLTPEQVLRAIAAPPPTAARLDQYLYGIARTHNVNWLPDLSPQQKYVSCLCVRCREVLSYVPGRVNALSPIVDPEIVAVVDLSNLRSLCSHGKSADSQNMYDLSLSRP